MSEQSLTGVVGPTTCDFHWAAPRYELPVSVDVIHVCVRDADHPNTGHLCSCGQMMIDG